MSCCMAQIMARWFDGFLSPYPVRGKFHRMTIGEMDWIPYQVRNDKERKEGQVLQGKDPTTELLRLARTDNRGMPLN